MSVERDVLIEGRGLSGYNLAANLAENGWNILLTGKEYKNPRSWFVLLNRLPERTRNLIKDGIIVSHPLDACRFIIVDSKTDKVTADFISNTHNQLNTFDCVMIDDKTTKQVFKNTALSHNNISTTQSSVSSITEQGKNYQVTLESGEKHLVNKVVDASGSASKLLRRLTTNPLQDDALVYWIYGYRAKGTFDPNTMIFPLKDTTTGRMSWVTPWSTDTADILAADYCRVSEFSDRVKNGHFREIYERFKQLCLDLNICTIDEELEKIYGRTRIVPLSTHYGGDGVYAVGDAAGQACPNMAEGVPPAILNSDYLANKLNENPDYRGQDYYRDWRFGRQKIEPYELSTSFLLARYPVEQAGQNTKIYQTIADMNDVNMAMNIMSERQISLKNLPTIIRILLEQPELVPRAISTLVRSKFAYILPRYRQILYGSNTNYK